LFGQPIPSFWQYGQLRQPIAIGCRQSTNIFKGA
jgi:hypothetical protein